MSTNSEKLECLSIIVCDDIYRDEQSKKLVIVGTFNAIQVTDFPYCHPKMSILLTLTNGHGQNDVSLTVEHGETGQPLAELSGPMNFDSPLDMVDINVKLQQLVFPEPGKYWVTLHQAGEIIKQRPIMVDRIEQKEETNADLS